jgi:hypothetical protein
MPALPEKGLLSKFDPKIPYFHKQKNEFMISRKEMLRLFITELLSHKELKFAREVQLFLTLPDNVIIHEFFLFLFWSSSIIFLFSDMDLVKAICI